MPIEPVTKRTVSFIDGQNLFHHAKSAFGHRHPNYDPKKLTDAVCAVHGWINHHVRFYTGMPDPQYDPELHEYWTRRLTAMRRSGISVTSRPLRYRIESVILQDGSSHNIPVKREKGIDLRLGLDAVRMARHGELDVALIFSQDQDLAEIAQEIRSIISSQKRWLKIVSAFPFGPNATVKRGINNTDWFRMDQQFYDACLDPRDYRPKRS